jgi:hypothetical protein
MKLPFSYLHLHLPGCKDLVSTRAAGVGYMFIAVEVQVTVVA